MINRYDTFTKLTEIIVGEVNLSVCNIIEDERERDLMCNVFESLDKTLTDKLAIPKNGKGESLNVGVAMGIFLYYLVQ